MLLEGKKALVTGARKGIGRGVAVRLAAEGADVGIADILLDDETERTASMVRDLGRKASVHQVDATKVPELNRVFGEFLSEHGRVDVLVNNAALYGGLKGARFEQLDEAQWDAVMNINVKGLWQCCKAVVDPMRAAGGGSIINISSLAAVYGLPYGMDYVASKAAVIGMTRAS